MIYIYISIVISRSFVSHLLEDYDHGYTGKKKHTHTHHTHFCHLNCSPKYAIAHDDVMHRSSSGSSMGFTQQWEHVSLVGGWPTPLGGMSSSVGMMKFPIYGKTKFMFQTTKQFKVVNGFEVPSGNLLQFAKFAIKHGHRNSWFTQL